jgi:hypothetical protein
LAETVDSVDGLLFYGRIPRWFEYEDVGRSCQVESRLLEEVVVDIPYATGFDGDQHDDGFWVVLEGDD